MTVKTTTIASCDAPSCPVTLQTFTTQPYLEARSAGWDVRHTTEPDEDEIKTYCPAHELGWCGTESHPNLAHPKQPSCIAFMPSKHKTH